MPLFVLVFPDIDPVLVHLGPVSIRWYAIAYIAGIVLAWLYVRSLVAKTSLWSVPDSGIPITTKTHIDDFIVWATLGVLVGGRLGFVVFYELLKHPEELMAAPWRAFYVWQGGMNFHGGLIGVILATVLFCRRHRIDVVRFGDAIACAVPFGLGFGRIANFINAEIWGKVSHVPWAIIPCNDRIRAANGGTCPYGEEPRLPVQLYEAVLEGLVLFVVLVIATRVFKGLRRPGLATGLFLIVYAAFRIFVEVMYRDSDNKLGGGWTLGIVLSVPMPIIGLAFLWNAFKDRFGPVPFAAPLARLMAPPAPKSGAVPDKK
jgi:phosphatidylglycerol:prolipoprotein diacylglycerol transferase